MSALSQLAKQLLDDSDLWSRTGMKVAKKEDGSPVSSVDLALNTFVCGFLNRIWPELWIVSEESPSSLSMPNTRRVAVVDPLDGTENFVSGLPIWGVSVAICQDGIHEGSMLAFPELGLSLATGDRAPQYASRIIGHPSSSPLASLVHRETGPENRIMGSAAFNLFCVATGRFASFSNQTGAYTWDILAGLNLALERGCRVIVNDREYRGELLDASQKYCFEVFR